MSKRELKKYLQQLSKEQLEYQIETLYNKFKDVKVYYDFAFNPQEDKLVEECKYKISKEYFPVNGKKAKTRRSVAQKYIRHFCKLGVENELVADIMLYNIEIAQVYCEEKNVKQDAFYISMYKSFTQAMEFISQNGLKAKYNTRIRGIIDKTWNQNWFNKVAFENTYSNT